MIYSSGGTYYNYGGTTTSTSTTTTYTFYVTWIPDNAEITFSLPCLEYDVCGLMEFEG